MLHRHRPVRGARMQAPKFSMLSQILVSRAVDDFRFYSILFPFRRLISWEPDPSLQRLMLDPDGDDAVLGFGRKWRSAVRAWASLPPALAPSWLQVARLSRALDGSTLSLAPAYERRPQLVRAAQLELAASDLLIHGSRPGQGSGAGSCVPLPWAPGWMENLGRLQSAAGEIIESLREEEEVAMRLSVSRPCIAGSETVHTFLLFRLRLHSLLL